MDKKQREISNYKATQEPTDPNFGDTWWNGTKAFVWNGKEWVADSNIHSVLRRVEEQLKNNHAVGARDIWHLIEYIKDKK